MSLPLATGVLGSVTKAAASRAVASAATQATMALGTTAARNVVQKNMAPTHGLTPDMVATALGMGADSSSHGAAAPLKSGPVTYSAYLELHFQHCK